LIPLTIPEISGNEWTYVKECLDTAWISSAGSYVSKFEEILSDFTDSTHAVACVNGTSGLHLALELSGVSSGDLVIMPNLTFVASANSVQYTGAEPILIDVCTDSWQFELDLLEEFLEHKTTLTDIGLEFKENGKLIKAIMPVHVLGNMTEMDRLIRIAAKYLMPVVEDASEALGSTYKGRHAGTFGSTGVFSFNGNKIISTGGGGMIVSNDEELARRAKHLSTQAKVSPEEYIHDEIGYNYRLVNVLAAIGVAQMEQLPGFLTKKREIDRFYREQLSGVGDITFQEVIPHVQPNCWLFTFRTKRMRELLRHLNAHGVQSRPFWRPMNQLPMYSHCHYVQKSDHSGMLYDQCISIPSSVGLTKEQMNTVVKTIKTFFQA